MVVVDYESFPLRQVIGSVNGGANAVGFVLPVRGLQLDAGEAAKCNNTQQSPNVAWLWIMKIAFHFFS